MCWTREVSAGFAALELACIAAMAVRCTRVDLMILPMLLSIAVVESMEVVQWHFVEPLASLHTNGPHECHPLNRWATIAVLVSITLQPFLWNLFLQKSNRNPLHAALFAFTRAAGLVLHLAYMASLAAGELWGFVTATHDFAQAKQGFKSMFGPSSCAYHGPHGHLQWTFKISLHEMAPNGLPYFLLLALPLFWHRPVWLAVVPGVAILSIWAALLVLLDGNWGEAGSVWCFTGVVLHVYFLVLPYVWEEGRLLGEGEGTGHTGKRGKKVV